MAPSAPQPSSPYRRRREYEHTAPENRALVAVMKNGRDMEIARHHGWYRIPVRTAPKHMDFGWLALYQTNVFKTEGSAVNYYGRVTSRTIVKRWELFPNEPSHPRAQEDYYKITFSRLERLPCLPWATNLLCPALSPEVFRGSCRPKRPGPG
jgi:hypothetical protein